MYSLTQNDQIKAIVTSFNIKLENDDEEILYGIKNSLNVHNLRTLSYRLSGLSNAFASSEKTQQIIDKLPETIMAINFVGETPYFFDKEDYISEIDTRDGFPVFSAYSSRFYNLFKENIPIVETCNQDLDFSTYYDALKYRNEVNKVRLTELIFKQDDIEIDARPKTYNVISMANFCTGTNYEISIRPGKSSDFISSKSSVIIPVLQKTKLFTNDETKEVLLFSLMFIGKKEKVSRYKKAQKYLYSILANGLDHENLYFDNLNEYNERLYSCIDAHHVKSSISFTQYESFNIDWKSNIDYSFQVPPNPEVNSVLIDIAKKVKLPDDFVKRFNRVKARKQNLNSQINKIKGEIVKKSTSIRSLRDLLESKERAERIKGKIAFLNERLQEIDAIIQNKENIRKSFNQENDEYTSAFKTTWNSNSLIKETYNRYQNEAVELSQTSESEDDQTLINTLDNVDVLKIVFKKKKDAPLDRMETVTLQDSNAANLSKSCIASLRENYTIHEVIFATKEPSIITVNNARKSKIVAGPFVIKCLSNSSMEIKARDKTSIFGRNTGLSTVRIHPHASCVSYETVHSVYQNCCLGEGQALLFNAMKSSCLKTIIYAAMIWVKSVNKNDVWGRSYRNFPTLEQYNASLINLKPQASKPSKAAALIKEKIEHLVQSDNDDDVSPQETLPEPTVQELENNAEPETYVRYTAI